VLFDLDADVPFHPKSENASSDCGDSAGGIHRSSSFGLIILNDKSQISSRGLLVCGGVETSIHVSPDFFSTVPRIELMINRTPDTDGRSDVARLFHENTNGCGPGTLLSTRIFLDQSNCGRSTRGREIPILTVGLCSLPYNLAYISSPSQLQSKANAPLSIQVVRPSEYVY